MRFNSGSQGKLLYWKVTMESLGGEEEEEEEKEHGPYRE